MERLVSTYAQLLAYVLIVVMGVLGFAYVQAEQNRRTEDRKQQVYALCVEARNTRQAIRDQITAVRVLAENLLPPAGPGVDSARDQLEAYELSQLAKYPPLPECPLPLRRD